MFDFPLAAPTTYYQTYQQTWVFFFWFLFSFNKCFLVSKSTPRVCFLGLLGCDNMLEDAVFCFPPWKRTCLLTDLAFLLLTDGFLPSPVRALSIILWNLQQCCQSHLKKIHNVIKDSTNNILIWINKLRSYHETLHTTNRESTHPFLKAPNLSHQRRVLNHFEWVSALGLTSPRKVFKLYQLNVGGKP